MPFKTFGTETLTSADVNSYLMTQCIVRCTSTTRPSAPSDGWFIYETDTQRRMLYSDGAWRQSGIYEEVKIKTQDSVQQAWGSVYLEDELPLTVLPNAAYWVDGFIQMSQQGSTAAGIQSFGLGAYWPVGSTIAMLTNAPIGTGNSDTTELRTQTFFETDFSFPFEDPNARGGIFNFSAWVNATGVCADMDFVIQTGSMGGKFGLTFGGTYSPTSGSLNDYAQVKATVHANSWLRSRRLF